MDFVLRDIGELTTNERGIVADGALAVSDGTIMWVGTDDAIPPAFRSLPVVGVGGRAVLPGFVDAHTHCVFAGDRSGEFARRMRGERYEDILDAGGGIRSTVEETRSASQEELVASARARLNRMLRQGTTTVEIKSGYGLDTATELKMLEVIAKLGETHPIDVVPTFLGAHVVPVEYWDDRAGYIRLIIEEMLPACAPYARYCDVFCDEGAFTVAEAREVLEAGLRFGLKPRMHVEQLAATGGVELAAELGAVSADHLDHVTPASMAALRSAGTVAVLLPAVSLSMKTPQPPARMLLDAGVPVAIATDCNPGTSYMESMRLVIALAVLEMGLTSEEAVRAATRGGALAVEDRRKGVVVEGAAADLIVLDAPNAVHLAYRAGTNLIGSVIKDGKFVVDGLSLSR